MFPADNCFCFKHLLSGVLIKDSACKKKVVMAFGTYLSCGWTVTLIVRMRIRYYLFDCGSSPSFSAILNEILFKVPGMTKNKVGIKPPLPNQARCISSKCKQHELSNWLATLIK